MSLTRSPSGAPPDPLQVPGEVHAAKQAAAQAASADVGILAPEPTVARPVVVVKLPAAEVARAGLVIIGVGLAMYLVWMINQIIFLSFLGILLATAIEPLVNRLRRGPFSRSSGALVVYTGIVILIGVPLLFIVPNLVGQTASFTENLPSRLEQVRPYAEQLQPAMVRSGALSALDSLHERFGNPAPIDQEAVVEIGATAAETLLHFVTVFFIAFYWLIERASIKRAILRMVLPARAKNVNAVWVEVEGKLGGWVRGQLLVMLVMAVIAGVGFFFLGLPNPVLLGVLVGICEAIPMIGPYLGFAPAVLVAFMIEPYLALLVLAFAVIIQQLEGNFLLPRIMGHVVGVSPLTVVLGILIGATLYGLPGAFVAVPVAAAVQVILAHVLRMEDPTQATAHNPALVRQAERETGQATAEGTAPIYQQVAS